MDFTIPTPVRYFLLIIFIIGGIYSFREAIELYRAGKEYDLYGILTIMCLFGILQNIARLYISPAETHKGSPPDTEHH